MTRLPAGETLTFAPVYQVQGVGYSDPLYTHEPDRSPPHLLSVNNNNDNTTELYESSDLFTWTLVDGDYSPVDSGSGNNLQDYVYHDGTYYVYASVNNDLRLLTGESFGSLTDQGVVLSGNDDAGVWEEDGTWHLYAEGDSAGATDNEIVHFRGDAPDGPFSEVGTVIDVSGKNWETGDPDIEFINGQYQMFMDKKPDDGDSAEYYIARAVSDDLDTWTMADENVTYHPGGDMQVTEVDGQLTVFTEFYGYQGGIAGVGYWREAHLKDGGYQVPMTAR